MNDYYYELETILNDLPQRTLAQKIQSLIYSLINQEKQNSPVLEVEKYFRKMIKKVEQFYCRRLEKLDYFIKKNTDNKLILLRISKYLEKKPWRLESMDFTKKKEKQKIDDKNCNQYINFDNNQNDYYSSRTSTPFSHYSCIPSIPRESSLNQAIFLDFDNTPKSSFSLDKDESSINISQIQLQLQQMMGGSNKKNENQTAQLSDLVDSELEEFQPQSPPPQNMLDCNISDIKSGLDSRLVSARSLHQEEPRQTNIRSGSSPKQNQQPREFESLFQTQQSTKEIIKYVEQYHQQKQFSSQKQKPSLEENTYQYFQDKSQSPTTNKRYRVRSSYQKELPSQNKLKGNTSHEVFEVRTAKSNQAKKKPFQLPSPLNESINQQKQKQFNQQHQQSQKMQIQRQPQVISSALSRLYKKFSQIKQSSSVVTKRSIKQTINYSLEKDNRKYPKQYSDLY